LPRSRKGQKAEANPSLVLKQAEPWYPLTARSQVMLGSAQTLPSATEGSVPAKWRLSLQRPPRGSRAALKSNLTAPWAPDSV